MSQTTPVVVKLPEQFVHEQLPELKTLVDQHQEGGTVVQFDANSLSRIDGSAVQFLLSVAKLQEPQLSEPLIINANEVMQNALIDMGLDKAITTKPSE